MNSESQSENHEEEVRTSPSIYVASLSDYNAGRLHGSWIDAAQTAEAVHAAISAMLAASPEGDAEEWAIHDYDGFGALRLGEYESVETITELANGIDEHGLAFAAWASHVGGTNAELERFEECFRGSWESAVAYVEDLLDDIGITSAVEAAAGNLAAYVRVDAEALARDMELGGELVEAENPEGGVFLFSP